MRTDYYMYEYIAHVDKCWMWLYTWEWIPMLSATQHHRTKHPFWPVDVAGGVCVQDWSPQGTIRHAGGQFEHKNQQGRSFESREHACLSGIQLMVHPIIACCCRCLQWMVRWAQDEATMYDIAKLKAVSTDASGATEVWS